MTQLRGAPARLSSVPFRLCLVLRHAAGIQGVSWVHLKVSAATPAAQRRYERAGFRVWGTEPAGARYNGQTVADYHMALSLEVDGA